MDLWNNAMGREIAFDMKRNLGEYQEAEFEAVSIISEKQGTMFQNSAVGVKNNVIKERVYELKRLYEILIY